LTDRADHLEIPWSQVRAIDALIEPTTSLRALRRTLEDQVGTVLPLLRRVDDLNTTPTGNHSFAAIASVDLTSNRLLLTAIDNPLLSLLFSNFRTLWSTDWSEAGTQKLSDAFIRDLLVLNGEAYFKTDETLWKTDGTPPVRRNWLRPVFCLRRYEQFGIQVELWLRKPSLHFLSNRILWIDKVS
jgi:hypothetical protein